MLQTRTSWGSFSLFIFSAIIISQVLVFPTTTINFEVEMVANQTKYIAEIVAGKEYWATTLDIDEKVIKENNIKNRLNKIIAAMKKKK